jgi:Flp pilus assembly protein protease CpaA
MTAAPNPLLYAALGVVGALAIYFDVRTRSLPDWLTVGGSLLGLGLALATGGWPAFKLALAGGVCGLGVFWLLWTLGMMGFGDVLLMAACGAILGWPLVLHGLLYATFAGALLGLGYSAARGNLSRVFRNLWTALASTFNPHRPRVRLKSLPTDELPYAVAVVVGGVLASLIPHVPVLSLL